jgi:hypothetical protein
MEGAGYEQTFLEKTAPRRENSYYEKLPYKFNNPDGDGGVCDGDAD